jgi:hypothetical protein
MIRSESRLNKPGGESKGLVSSTLQCKTIGTHLIRHITLWEYLVCNHKLILESS